MPETGRRVEGGSDREVLRAALDWLAAGDPVTLVTVARTWGSAPRRPGALMALGADGLFVGSVSGGCVEDDLVQRSLRGELERRLPRLVEYGVGAAEVRRVGLPCGGRLALVVEPLTDAAPLRRLLATVEARRLLARRVCLDTGETGLVEVPAGESVSFDGHTLIKVFGPVWRLLIIGAGELSQRVARLGLALDYAVTLCDPRPEYASGWEVEGTDFVAAPAEALMPRFAPDRNTVVLALAHAPPLEDAALAAALRSDAGYIGALGSRRNQQARLERLARLGLSAAQLGRLHGPVGLDIGSRTPAEIAIAIAAGLIEARNRPAQAGSRASPRAETVARL
jgi:xanthine dehydrogenase accessory factor